MPAPVASQPLLGRRGDSTAPLLGPGHPSLFSIGTTTWMACRAWQVGADGRRGTRRFLHIDRVDRDADGNPVVRGPTLLPWTAPSPSRPAIPATSVVPAAPPAGAPIRAAR